MNYKRPTAIVGFDQAVSETNKYQEGPMATNERTYQTRTKPHQRNPHRFAWSV